jgi:hypothetical protein
MVYLSLFELNEPTPAEFLAVNRERLGMACLQSPTVRRSVCVEGRQAYLRRGRFTCALDETLLATWPAAAVIRSEAAEDPSINYSGAQGHLLAISHPTQAAFGRRNSPKFVPNTGRPDRSRVFGDKLRNLLLNRYITGCDRGMANLDHAHGQDPKRSPATTEPLPLEGHSV